MCISREIGAFPAEKIGCSPQPSLRGFARKKEDTYSMQDTGRLIFRVYTSDADIPVEGATVLIRQQEPPGRLLGVRVTNSSGETDPVELKTPGRSLSQTPEHTVQPWTGLSVMVEHPEYERVTLQGLQVFPGIETIQTVRLLPLRRFDPQKDGQEDFTFPPQPIWEGA